MHACHCPCRMRWRPACRLLAVHAALLAPLGVCLQRLCNLDENEGEGVAAGRQAGRRAGGGAQQAGEVYKQCLGAWAWVCKAGRHCCCNTLPCQPCQPRPVLAGTHAKMMAPRALKIENSLSTLLIVMPLMLPPSAPSAAQVCEQARVSAQSYTSLVQQVCCLQPTAGRRADPNRGYSRWGETSNQHHSPPALQPSSPPASMRGRHSH